MRMSGELYYLLMAIVSLILCTINLYINALKRHIKSRDVGVLWKAAKLKTENFTSALKEDGKPSNSQKLLLPFVDLCHLCDWFSRCMDLALSYIFFTVINFDMEKERENLIFFLFSYKKLSAKDQLTTFSMPTSW